MKNIFIMVLVCIAVFSCNQKAIPSHTCIVNTTILNENNQPILAGHCSLAILQHDPYAEWYTKNYQEYKVDTLTAMKLSPFLQNKTMEIFLGSWCGDSKREVPKMLKLLQVAGFDTSHLSLIFVDNSTAAYKQSPQHEELGKGIHHVPTFIMYEGKMEIGRIVETPSVSLEKDLLAIFNKEEVPAKYKAIAWWQQEVNGKKKSLDETQLKDLATTLKLLCRNAGEFNAYGYVLLAQKNYKEAINVFKLNTFIYPDDAGTYDSLGEGFMVAGNKKEAVNNYEKVLQLKPGDENALQMLEKLK